MRLIRRSITLTRLCGRMRRGSSTFGLILRFSQFVPTRDSSISSTVTKLPAFQHRALTSQLRCLCRPTVGPHAEGDSHGAKLDLSAVLDRLGHEKPMTVDPGAVLALEVG